MISIRRLRKIELYEKKKNPENAQCVQDILYFEICKCSKIVDRSGKFKLYILIVIY